jgi:hypothetical protein
MFRIIRLFRITLFPRLFVRVDISPARGNHLHDRITTLKWEVLVQCTSLPPANCIVVPIPCQECKSACTSRGIDFTSFYDFDIWFGIVPAVWFFVCFSVLIFFSFVFVFFSLSQILFSKYLVTFLLQSPSSSEVSLCNSVLNIQGNTQNYNYIYNYFILIYSFA